LPELDNKRRRVTLAVCERHAILATKGCRVVLDITTI
jgi:hypothetical protein